MINGQGQSAFTLLEMVMTVAIVGIIVTVSMPSLRTAIQNTRMTAQLNDLTMDINLARNEAITRGMRVIMCRKNSAGTDCNNGGAPYAWEDGWIIYVDRNGNNTFNAVGDTTPCQKDGLNNLIEDCLLKKHAAFDDNTLRFPNKDVIFDGRGFSTGSAGTFTLCDDRGDSESKTKVLSPSGRLSTGSTGNCP